VASSDPGAATVGLWAQQPLPATWVEEGTATRDDTVNPPVYRAQVTHFSQFVSGTRAAWPYKLIVKVVDNPTIPSPVPVVGAAVKVVDIGAAVVQVGTTDANGFCIFRMPGTSYYIKAAKTGHVDKGVYSLTQQANVLTAIYWLEQIATGGGGRESRQMGTHTCILVWTDNYLLVSAGMRRSPLEWEGSTPPNQRRPS